MKKLAEKTLFSSSVLRLGSCAVSFQSPTLPEVIATANQNALYYALVCGYPDVRVAPVEEVCATCYGDGEVAKGLRRVRCRECRGEGRRRVLAGWDLKLPDDVEDHRTAITNLIGVVSV